MQNLGSTSSLRTDSALSLVLYSLKSRCLRGLPALVAFPSTLNIIFPFYCWGGIFSLFYRSKEIVAGEGCLKLHRYGEENEEARFALVLTTSATTPKHYRLFLIEDRDEATRLYTVFNSHLLPLLDILNLTSNISKLQVSYHRYQSQHHSYHWPHPYLSLVYYNLADILNSDLSSFLVCWMI